MFATRDTQYAREPVRLVGGGAVGTEIIGAAQRAVVIDNGLVRVHYGARTPDGQRGSHMLQVPVNGSFVDAMEPEYGDWSYFVTTIGTLADRTTVVENSDEAVELALRWDAHDFSASPRSSLNWGHLLNYPESSAIARTITSTRLTKTIRVVRGVPGYFVGWHSWPLVGPEGGRIPTDNNDNSWGEREVGISAPMGVCWSSNAARPVCRWPAWGDDVDGRWTANGLGAEPNKPWWAGIDDPSDPPYNGAGWIAVQGAGFPGEQAAGPFYVGGLHHTLPIAFVLACRQRFEIGCWSFNQRPIVLHYTNEAHTPNGVPYRHAAFIGGFQYSPRRESAYANEPTAAVQERVALLASGLDWPTT